MIKEPQIEGYYWVVCGPAGPWEIARRSDDVACPWQLLERDEPLSWSELEVQDIRGPLSSPAAQADGFEPGGGGSGGGGSTGGW